MIPIAIAIMIAMLVVAPEAVTAPEMIITVAMEIAPLTAPMGVAPAAVPMAAMPAIAFAAIPGEVHAPPVMPAAAIPEIGPPVGPAVIMRTAHGDAVDHDRAAIDGIAAIAGIIVIVRVARSGGIIAGPIIISERRAHPDADIHTGKAHAKMHLGAGRRRGKHAHRHQGARHQSGFHQ